MSFHVSKEEAKVCRTEKKKGKFNYGKNYEDDSNQN